MDELTNKIPNAVRKVRFLFDRKRKRAVLAAKGQAASSSSSGSAKFSDALFAKAMNKFKGLLAHPESVRHIPKVLADAGIRFVIIENLPRTGIDGVCLWLDKLSPVIALSLFRDRMDSVWFTLFHEMDHVKNRDGLMLPPVVDSRLTGEDAVFRRIQSGKRAKGGFICVCSLIRRGDE